MVNLLQPIGFDISEANNGQEGLEKALSLTPDLIISDLVMPVMDGFEMMRQLRKLPQLQNIILVTSSASVFEIDRHKSIDAGADEFLPKPVQAEVLLEMLRVHLQLQWILAVLSQVLKNAGLKVRVAVDGESAIAQAEYALPELILLDIQRPGIDGFEACQRLKANPLTSNIPIIFMTALADTENKIKGLSLGQ